MKKSIRTSEKVTIGLDLGDKYSYFYAVDSRGNCLEEGRVRTTPEALRKHFSGIEPALVAIETGTHSPWVSRLLSKSGHEVIVANSRELRLIYKNKKKSDREDARNLARTARIDPRLLCPIQHRGVEEQASLAVLRARDSLVEARTKLVNHVRGAVKSFGGRIPSCSAPSFHRKAPESIPQEIEGALKPIVRMIEELTSEIRRYDRAIEELSKERYPVTELLRQVPGIGPITALAFVLILADPRRFKKSRMVGPYLGLTPRHADSGASVPQLRITKAGDVFLRQLLVSAAHYILGPFGPDTDLRRFGAAIAARGGKNAKKRAAVAVGRELAVLLHRLWVSGEVYEPLRQSRRGRRRSPLKGASKVA